MQPHTPEHVFDAFVRATELAKRLPSARPASITSPWPDILRLGHEGYAENEKAKQPLTAEEMKAFEETSKWMSFLKNESDRRILWAYAAGIPGWKICKACRPAVSQSTVSRRIIWALAFISSRLDAGVAPPGFEVQE
jgi:hypothetical protein